jgi:hypothetical protein
MENINFLYSDNFLNISEIRKIQKEVIYHNPFFFNPFETPIKGDQPDYVFGDMFEDFPFFVSGQNSISNNKIEEISYFIFNKFAIQNNINNKKVVRAKCNLTTITKEKKPSWPHVDGRDDHYVFLYYVNDSDGDTVIYNQEFVDKQYKQEDMTIFKQISPKAGSAIFFNGKYFHTYYSPQKNNIRCVINMNLEDMEITL